MTTENYLNTPNPPKHQPQLEQQLNPGSCLSSRDLSLEEQIALSASNLNLKDLRDRQREFLRAKIAEAEWHSVVDCLRIHNVGAKERAYMVNWMIEVINVFKCDDRTLFVAVMIMDSYYKNCQVYLLGKENRKNEVEELYLVGVVSLFLAAKFIDCDSLHLDIVTSKIAHNQFSNSEIKMKEIEILTAIEYKIDTCTIHEFIQMLFLDFFLTHKKTIDKEALTILKQVKQLSIYFAVMCCYDYNMLQYK